MKKLLVVLTILTTILVGCSKNEGISQEDINFKHTQDSIAYVQHIQDSLTYIYSNNLKFTI